MPGVAIHAVPVPVGSNSNASKGPFSMPLSSRAASPTMDILHSVSNSTSFESIYSTTAGMTGSHLMSVSCWRVRGSSALWGIWGRGLSGATSLIACTLSNFQMLHDGTDSSHATLPYIVPKHQAAPLRGPLVWRRALQQRESLVQKGRHADQTCTSEKCDQTAALP